MLEKFQLVAFKVEDAKSLKSVRKDFKNLKELELSMYDLEEESSSDEENDEDDSGLMGRSNIEVVSFFLQTAVNLKVKQKIRDSPFLHQSPPGGEVAHELRPPPQLLLPHLSLGQEPLNPHFTLAYIKVKSPSKH